MKSLYIDTSSSYLYSGIVEKRELLAECKINYGKDLSKFALSEIKNMFKKTNLSPVDIDKIIVVSGPGSFTGIRIGMTFAKIFAWSLNKKITTISSLDAMSSSINSNKLIVPVIDARRGYVYAGVYENDELILENQYIKLEDLINYLKTLNKEYIFVTNNDNLKLDNIIKYNPNILKIVLKYQEKESINPHLVEPNYLKLVEAEENLRNLKNDN